LSGSTTLYARMLVQGYGFEELSASFWISKWRVPKNIEDDVYAAILCIDPYGVRLDKKGPIIYVLDSITMKPGLSGKNGAFTGTINDNANTLRADMELLREGTKWIRDQDEFWIGFQRGPDPGGNEPHGAWEPTGGTDGEGAGRKWIMGGYISQRVYSYQRDTTITATIVGKDYMDVWEDQIFGTPAIPRIYITATDVATIARDVVTDINAFQPAGWQYSIHPTYFAVSFGTSWAKEFRQERSSDVYRDIADEIGYEWRIDYRRRVMLYPRTSPPVLSVTSPAYSLRYTANLQELPEIVMGDTGELVTHAIITDGGAVIMPPDIDAWCMSVGLWPDLAGNDIRGYSAASKPAPCNPATSVYADSTLIMDDEGHPALCFQSERSPAFDMNLSITSVGGSGVGSNLHLDLREWRRLIFKFKHPTRTGAGSIYHILLLSSLSDFYLYTFGLGATSPQLVSGVSEADTIDDVDWSLIDIMLPELDVDGVVVNTHGWVQTGAPDPTDIGWPSIYVNCNEVNPGNGPGQLLTVAANTGDQYLSVLNSELFAGLISGKLVFWQDSVCLLQKGMTSEEVRITGVNLSSIPAPYNIELQKPIWNSYSLGIPNAWLYVKGGWTMCFSQFRFERNLRLQDSKVGATPPYRYRMMIAKEMDTLNEAQVRANTIIEQETVSKKYVKGIVDGNPEFEIGQRCRLYLGVNPFQNVPTIIDDIEYRLGPDLEFGVDLTLGLVSTRSADVSELAVMSQQDRHIRNIGLGKTKMVIE